MEDLNLNKKFLDKKHIILIVLILFLAIVAIILFFLLKSDKSDNSATTISFTSSNLTISVPTNYKFSKIDKDSYDLVLRSDTSGSAIYFSHTSANTIRDKIKFVEYDKNDYISKFSNISEVSEVSQKNINGLETYNYHFRYKETMYIDVYWILKDSTFYTIDFNINTSSDDLTPYVEEILNSLKLN